MTEQRLADMHRAFMTWAQSAYRAENGNEPMPADLENAVSAGFGLLCDVVYALDKIARSVEMIAARVEAEATQTENSHHGKEDDNQGGG